MSACATVRRAISASVATGEPGAIFLDASGRAIFGAGETAEQVHRDLIVAAAEVERQWGRTTTRYAGAYADGRVWTVLVRRAPQDAPATPAPAHVWVVWYTGPTGAADIDGAYAAENAAETRANELSDEFTESGKTVDVWVEALGVRS